MLKSLQTLKADPQFWTQVAIGGLLVWLSMHVSSLLTPLILLPMGYAFALLKGALQGKDDLPSWGDVGEHVVNGVFAFILFLLYLLPAMLLQVLAGVSGMTASTVGGLITKFLGLGFFLLSCAGFAFFLIALARYAATGKFASSFSLAIIARQIAQSANDLVLLVGLCAFVGTFLTMFAGMLSGLVPFGLIWLVAGAASFALGMVSAHATGVFYREKLLHQESPAKEPAIKAARPALSVEPDEQPGLTRIRGNDDGWA